MTDIRRKVWPDISDCVRVDNWYTDEPEKKAPAGDTFKELQRPWTPEDDRQLMRLYGQGISQRQIADEMMRSRASVGRRLGKLREKSQK